ncbi:hypothetical protein LINPERPRIM_LOCUS30562 [Linum perenne]
MNPSPILPSIPTLIQFHTTFHIPQSNQLHTSMMQFQSIKPSPNSSSQFHCPLPRTNSLTNSISQF